MLLFWISLPCIAASTSARAFRIDMSMLIRLSVWCMSSFRFVILVLTSAISVLTSAISALTSAISALTSAISVLTSVLRSEISVLTSVISVLISVLMLLNPFCMTLMFIYIKALISAVAAPIRDAMIVALGISAN